MLVSHSSSSWCSHWSPGELWAEQGLLCERLGQGYLWQGRRVPGRICHNTRYSHPEYRINLAFSYRISNHASVNACQDIIIHHQMTISRWCWKRCLFLWWATPSAWTGWEPPGSEEGSGSISPLSALEERKVPLWCISSLIGISVKDKMKEKMQTMFC